MESWQLSKATKEMDEDILPEIAKIIAVAISTAVGAAVTDKSNVCKDMLKLASQNQKQCLFNRYENDKLEQYQHNDNLCIFGLEEEEEEREDALEMKVIELASDMGVTLQSGDISVAHVIGKQRIRVRYSLSLSDSAKEKREMKY